VVPTSSIPHPRKTEPQMSSSRRILSFSEYVAIRHPCPYVVDLGANQQRLLLFGGRHTSDPADPMFARIEESFASVTPAFAMHEGTPPHVEADREIAIRRHGEAGLVCYLAAGAGIGTASMDIPLPEEAATLRRELSQGDALVFFVVRQLASFNRKTARMDFDGYFGDFFDLIAKPLGVDRIDWSTIESEHLRLMGKPLSRNDVTGWETDPTREELPTQRIASRSNRLRDEYMLARLVRAVAEHGRVFATVGVTHAVMLEPALRESLTERSAR
jgi:hypothetical protein